MNLKIQSYQNSPSFGAVLVDPGVNTKKLGRFVKDIIKEQESNPVNVYIRASLRRGCFDIHLGSSYKAPFWDHCERHDEFKLMDAIKEAEKLAKEATKE